MTDDDRPSLRALLLAPPGAGKGTQGERLAEHYDVPHLATGDLLRRHVAEGTETGNKVAALMASGELVSDDLVVELVLAEIGRSDAADGFVLDGFPRTLEQATTAYEWGSARDRTFQVVLLLDVPTPELVRRLLERGAQQGRADDDEVTILHRLEVYRRSTKPLIEYYESRGILAAVDGTGTVDEVTARLVEIIDERLRAGT